jgi:hypothetical protein
LTPRFVPRSTTLTFTPTNSVSTRMTSFSEISCGPVSGGAGVPAATLGLLADSSGRCCGDGDSAGPSGTVRVGTTVVTRTLTELVGRMLMLPAWEYRRTELVPVPNLACSWGLLPRAGDNEDSADETFPVFESAMTVAPASAGTSSEISPEKVCARSAAGKPWTSTAPSLV